MTQKEPNKQAPNEIPEHKHPNPNQEPIKNPDLNPSESNPINPQDDESTKNPFPGAEPHSPGYDENEGERKR